MKLLHRYYRWRAEHATGEKKEHFKKMAWYSSDSYQYGGFVGVDLTRFPDPQAMKQELTADIGQKPVDKSAMRVNGGMWPHKPGRYLDGPYKEPYWDEAEGKMIDPNVWKETPQWWADVPEANQQHQPTYRSARRGGIVKFDPETGKRTYWKYDYKTGKQEQVK